MSQIVDKTTISPLIKYWHPGGTGMSHFTLIPLDNYKNTEPAGRLVSGFCCIFIYFRNKY